MKIYNFLKNEIQQEPKKLHSKFGIRDIIQIIQTMHDFAFKQSDYPDFLKKIFFYESSMIYEGKLNKKSDIELFRTKICEAYSAVFKQDKLTVEDVYNEKWNLNQSYAFCYDYNNFNNDNVDLRKELCFIDNKMTLGEFLGECKNDSSWKAKDYNLASHNCQDFIAKVIEILKVKRADNNETKFSHLAGRLNYPPVIVNALEKNDTPAALRITQKIPVVGIFSEFAGFLYKKFK